MNQAAKFTLLYERLSRDDEMQGESNSILNQKKLLEDYANKHGYTNIIHFTDDGVSGLRFDRPGFLGMNEVIKEKKAAVLLVKDMSRIGRDYLKVGQYMEMLRQNGVRLIAINDNVDTVKEDDDFTPFRNIMNEWYARDISKKLRSSFRTKGMSGKHLSSVVPYGYLKSSEDRNKWVVDEEAAEVVRRIFKMTTEGMGPYQIACILEQDKVEIPAVHLAKHKEGLWKTRSVKNPYHWQPSTIVRILEREDYLGRTVNFKTTKHFKDRKSKYQPKENWVVFENTQESIIDEETFELVRKVRNGTRKCPDGWGEPHILTGLMYCADCGSKMYVHRTCNGKRIAAYVCGGYTSRYRGSIWGKDTQKCDSGHRIQEETGFEILKKTLRKIAQMNKEDETAFYKTICCAANENSIAENKHNKQKIEKNNQRITQIDSLLCKAYEDKVFGKMDDSVYISLEAKYVAERNSLVSENKILEDRVKKYEKGQISPKRFLKLIKKYESFDELTPVMINELIDRIVVHKKIVDFDQPYDTQEIEIYFNFIGKVDVNIDYNDSTEEDEEALKLRAKRRRRAHERYLKYKDRRKSYGARKKAK